MTDLTQEYLKSILDYNAAKAYNVKAKELHGEFAHLNKVTV